MEEILYRISLVLTGLINFGMAGWLQNHTGRYAKYPTYQMTRILTTVWLIAFGVGYMIHAMFFWRFTWPTAASALTVTYFHIGAVCFSWGYTSLLDPTFMKKKVIVRDFAIYIIGLICYWSVALIWKDAPTYTILSFCYFFAYAVYCVITFYRTYNRVSYRLLKLSQGSVAHFVRWMQVCCDLIILFGISSVAFTGIFPNDLWPYVVLLFMGVGMFGYMVYSLEKYGSVIDDATRVTYNAAVKEKRQKKNRAMHPFHLLLLTIAALTAIALTSCKEHHEISRPQLVADSLLNQAHIVHEYDSILSLADREQEQGLISDIKACYWRGYAYDRLRQVRLAEREWNEALSCHIENAEDLEFYSKSANRLASLLYMKSEYEGTIRVALPAIKLLKQKDYAHNTDYANLHTFVGNCMLKLGHPKKATDHYMVANELYQQLIKEDPDISNYNSSIIGIITIIKAYMQTGRFEESIKWIGTFEAMLDDYRKLPQADSIFIDKQFARLNFYRGYSLEGMGQKEEAHKAYMLTLGTRYAETAEGQIEATNYLMAAHRWEEAADKFRVLEGLMAQYDVKMSLENVKTYLLPKYKANKEAHRNDSAIAMSTWICNSLDTAIDWERQNAAVELATIYDLQQKETELAEQKANLSQQRFMSTVATLLLVVFGFGLFIYFRHQAAMRLESAYFDLEVANARAEESSRYKSEFIHQISHEIRTPLNILSGFTQIITTPGMELDEDTREDINRQVLENTNRITGLVNKMLELSDVRSQTVIEQNDTVTAVEIAAEAVSVSGIEEAAHLTFSMEVRPEAESAVLHTNRQAAVRALSLILDNARKFTAPAESLVNNLSPTDSTLQQASLSLEVADENIQFAVVDSGIGVPVEEAERIFDEFVQLNEYYNGTGIGLTVARSMARRLGGDVMLDTAYTQGTRFVMTLPMMT